MTSTPTPDSDIGGDAPLQRCLGRFGLQQLLGKSQRCMAWRVFDPQAGRELVLVMPRVQPADAATLQRWRDAVQRAARLEHPNLARALEVGVCERWPYVAYERAGASTLGERLPGLPASEAAACLAGVLRGLAYAHDGAVAHRDLQPFLVLVGESGTPRLMGLEVALGAQSPGSAHAALADALSLAEQREAARLDLLCAGLLLHLTLSGQPALGQPDLGLALAELPPQGRELVRLPWNTPQPIPEPLRAIANRSTDRQPRQRYGSARGLLRALEGWLRADSADDGGALALLIDRLHSVGSLPASPGSAERAARLALMERHRTNELAQVVLQDLALAFELLRWVNSVQVRGAQAAGSGPVLTVRRAIAMLGLDGVRRAALALRPWPGPLAERAAGELQALIETVKRAGAAAMALRPAGYDAEVVYLVTLLQNLGRLITCYHFPDELLQIRRLMQPAPAQRDGEADEPGMGEQAAAYAVLGTDIEAIGVAVARHWGMDESVQHLIRRLPVATPPRSTDGDDDILRAVASCANEAVDALALPQASWNEALARVAQRYTRSLKITLRDLQAALKLPATARGARARAAARKAAEAESAAAQGSAQ